MKNIFAKIIYTTNETLKDLIKNRFNFENASNIENIEIYSKFMQDFNLVFIFSKENNISKTIKYVKENYEIISFFNIGTALSLSDLDNIPGDVYIPNTIINENNEAIFLENYIDLNYDLKKFGLIMNGVCYSTTNINNESDLEKLSEEYFGEILDNECYFIASEVNKNDLLEKFSTIKITSNEAYLMENGVDIIELMI